MDVRLGRSEAGDDRRDPLRLERRDDRQSSARPSEERSHAKNALERVRAELYRRSVGPHQAGRHAAPLDLDLGS